MQNKVTQLNPILVDMDGVFCDFVHAFYEIARIKYPTVFEVLPEPDRLSKFYIEDEITDPIIKEEASKIIIDPQLFYMMPPIKGAIEGMHELQRKAEQIGTSVYICTAPHVFNKDSYKAKAEWVHSFLGHDWAERLLIVRDKTVCNGIVLIDDKPYVHGNFRPNWSHVLFKQSYNSQVTNKVVMEDWSSSSTDYLIDQVQKMSVQ